jgi:hypothetical protein
MPESGTFGSVRGVLGNGHPYRDPPAYPVVRKSLWVCSPLLLRVSASVNNELALAANSRRSQSVRIPDIQRRALAKRLRPNSARCSRTVAEAILHSFAVTEP